MNLTPRLRSAHGLLRSGAFAGIVMLLVTVSAAAAQERSLSWPSIHVDAHLDSAGRLEIRERQSIRFNGDWNGGERRFAVRLGEDFSFRGMTRVDSIRGTVTPLHEDDLDAVDEFKWFDSRLLRWRSRLPNDRPFSDSIMTYELSYDYGFILERQDDGSYLLDHNFVFTDRDGVIERFTLRLTIDGAWRPPADFTGEYAENNLERGRAFVVRVPLTRVAASEPAAVARGASAGTRWMLGAILLTGVAALVARLLRSDARRGRFAPLSASDAITPQWLEREVYAHLPEVVGAAWDDTTSQAEVAATLARLVQEKKLSSRVETKQKFLSDGTVLHLALEVPRNKLVDHERKLIDALFESGAKTTDTERVRERYRKSGFDPAAVIRAALKERASLLVPASNARASRLPTFLLMGAALGLTGLAASMRLTELAVLAVLGISLPFYGIAWLIASDWRRRVRNVWIGGSFLLLFIGILVIAASVLILVGVPYRFSGFALGAVVLWVLALVNSICNRAALALSPEGVVKRKQLAAARAFFAEELSRPSPSFDDATYPYLLAFGLGPHVDRWFRAFGGQFEATARSSSSSWSSASGSGGSSSGSNTGFSGFGGSGAFSGGGGGASFGAAIGGLAASVPSPSSSSSGGSSGGGGGGSSGGGGGGGW